MILSGRKTLQSLAKPKGIRYLMPILANLLYQKDDTSALLGHMTQLSSSVVSCFDSKVEHMGDFSLVPSLKALNARKKVLIRCASLTNIKGLTNYIQKLADIWLYLASRTLFTRHAGG